MKKKKKEPIDPAAKEALQQFKQELAMEMQFIFPSACRNQQIRETHSLGDYMVDRMIRSQENKM